MTPGEEPSHHHLPKMIDDPDDDDGDDDQQHYPYPPPNYHPSFPDQQPDYHPPHYPPPQHRNHPSPRPQPTPPPHRTPPPPTPRHTPPPPPHSKRRSPTPPPPASSQSLQKPPPPAPPSPPTPPPQKPRAAPPYTNFDDEDDDEDDKYSNLRRQICGVLFAILLLVGLVALILWLIYRPHKPKSAAVYFLNVTSPPFISASLQITIVTHNPNKRTSLYYDGLTVGVYYRNQAITPPVSLPPLALKTRTAVMMSPVVEGATVMAAGDVVEGLAADEAYGVVGLSWVMVGRVRYKAGGWFRSGHGRVFVRCDVIVGLKQGTPGVLNGGAFSNPSGQVPLLGAPPCFVDM
uniref:Late embryogenesis abundant protein LEA-2 subgroup domain-containing protein n=1 Tax=Opuntia streptacantha TaxID=393608 RepID=A0A7C9ABQ8_OPUST